VVELDCDLSIDCGGENALETEWSVEMVEYAVVVTMADCFVMNGESVVESCEKRVGVGLVAIERLDMLVESIEREVGID